MRQGKTDSRAGTMAEESGQMNGKLVESTEGGGKLAKATSLKLESLMR